MEKVVKHRKNVSASRSTSIYVHRPTICMYSWNAIKNFVWIIFVCENQKLQFYWFSEHKIALSSLLAFYTYIYIFVWYVLYPSWCQTTVHNLPKSRSKRHSRTNTDERRGKKRWKWAKEMLLLHMQVIFLFFRRPFPIHFEGIDK